MSELHIIEKPITRVELKKIAEERFGNLKEREIIAWISYNWKQYMANNITKEQLKETLILGIEDILSR